MISTIKRLVVGTVAMIGLTGAANAAYVATSWTDEITSAHYIAPGGSYSYTHNLIDNGFKPLDDIITSFSLAIDLYDDSTRDSFEIADIDISGAQAGYVTSFTFGNDAFKTGWTLSGLIELNLYGTLSVTVSSVCNLLACGDFNLGTSTLVAKGYTQQVPEPGTIALLGLGLLGVGLGRRKRLAK